MTFFLMFDSNLPHQDIKKIDNLNGLDNLIKLQLDNNVITEICCLSHLVKLEWLGDYLISTLGSFFMIMFLIFLSPLFLFDLLDLSFNQISKIQGKNCIYKIHLIIIM